MAEQLVNEFTVNRPIEEAWPVICDVERIAPCLPGAQLEEIEGDVYRGVVKVKLGAVSTQFKGQAQFVERDDESHRATLRAEGRDTGGRGNASADITAEAQSLSPTSTKCLVTTDLHITGKVAQFGRGIMGDVSKKLMEQFASNLNTMLDNSSLDASSDGGADAEPAAASAEPAGSGTASTAEAGAAATSSGNGSGSSTASKRVISGPATEPIDVAGMAGPAILKRLGPVVLALLLVFLLLRRRR
jgi:carbon monoxide dehydrogenase subunit G